MRVLTHKRRAQWLSGRRLIGAVALTAIALVVVFASIITLLITFAPQASDSPFLLIAMAAASIIVGLRVGSLLSRRVTPHAVLEAALKGLSAESRLYNYWLPANHALISPHGVFTLTPYNGEKPIVLTSTTTKDVARLLERARSDAQRTQAWLDSHLPESGVKVQPVLVLTDPRASFVVESDPGIPILYADKRKPSLKAYIRNQSQPSLSASAVAQLDRVLRIPHAH